MTTLALILAAWLAASAVFGIAWTIASLATQPTTPKD